MSIKKYSPNISDEEFINEFLPDLKQEIEEKTNLELAVKSIITQDKDTQRTIARAKWVASHKLPVMITGPTGTGKELLAKVLHGNRKGTFVAVNCGGIPDTLLESEFFGHVKGAFTGASETRIGYFEEAQDGTLFLDEIAELPRFLQSKLLRVLQEKKVRRIGSVREIDINCRIVSATNCIDLDKNDKMFRQDLYYRLAGCRLFLKSLVLRGQEEIKLLYKHLCMGKLEEELSEEKLNYDWPGNIRELINYCEEQIIFKEFQMID